jgi:hypothetical protein
LQLRNLLGKILGKLLFEKVMLVVEQGATMSRTLLILCAFIFQT